MHIRVESEEDYDVVRSLNTAAFETSAEAKLVDILRAQAHPTVSLVTEIDGSVVGHILFSPVTLEGHSDTLVMGIGTALVREGLNQCRQAGVQGVVVLGHPSYYPRFGFKPSSEFGISCEYDVPEDVFMVMELHQNALRGKSGMIRYHAAFNDV